MTAFDKRITLKTAKFFSFTTHLSPPYNRLMKPKRILPLANVLPLMDSTMTKTLPTPTHEPYFEKPAKPVKQANNYQNIMTIETLSSQLLGLENRRTDMKRVNQYIKKGDLASLRKSGYSEKGINKLLNPDEGTTIGYSRNELAINYAAIRLLKTKIGNINKLANRTSVNVTTDRYTYQECMETARILIKFSKQPQQWVCDLMCRHGFKYSYETKAWQRLLDQAAIYSTNFLRKELDKENANFFI